MSEETKEMEEVVESEEVEEEAVAEAKVTKHDGDDSAKKNPDMAKDVKKAKSESKVKEDDDEEEEDSEEEEEQTKKEALEVPKLKSEILAGLVDHLKGLKKEDLSKIYGSQVIGEEEGDDEDEEEEDP